MAGVYKLESQESEEDLRQLLRQQKSASECIHLLYLLRSRQVKTVQDAAPILGRNRVTLQNLYGIVEPKTGEHFFSEFSHLNTDCFQVFLNLVSEQFKEDLLILQLDNGGFHKAKRLQVPANIILLFQPPHCPELNPIEQVWQYLKRGLRWSL